MCVHASVCVHEWACVCVFVVILEMHATSAAKTEYLCLFMLASIYDCIQHVKVFV